MITLGRMANLSHDMARHTAAVDELTSFYNMMAESETNPNAIKTLIHEKGKKDKVEWNNMAKVMV